MRIAIVCTLGVYCLCSSFAASPLNSQMASKETEANSPKNTDAASVALADMALKYFGEDLRISRIYGSLKLRAAGLDCVEFSPDGRHLATSGYRSIYLWDPQTGELVDRLALTIVDCQDIAYSPDGKSLSYCGNDGLMAEHGQFGILDLESRREIVTVKDVGDRHEFQHISYPPMAANHHMR